MKLRSEVPESVRAEEHTALHRLEVYHTLGSRMFSPNVVATLKARYGERDHTSTTLNDVLVAAHTAFYRYVVESDNPLDDIAPGPVNYRPNIVTETFLATLLESAQVETGSNLVTASAWSSAVNAYKNHSKALVVSRSMQALVSSSSAEIRSTYYRHLLLLDATRSTPYYATPPEMTAQAFGGVVHALLADRGISNELLSALADPDRYPIYTGTPLFCIQPDELPGFTRSFKETVLPSLQSAVEQCVLPQQATASELLL